ncbi:type II secretion system F family protein [Epibacterium ulvae]|uniref:type II secretion system F family protein n=1 Tax=Epibacterium ulvae TaxID=1156985 RepID=UPI002493BCEC|nr:type II secretion system F family protein [Epibacterium ulvae]
MPVYSYKGCNRTGADESGTIEASNEKLAFDTLQSRGVVVFDLSIGTEALTPSLPWYRRDIAFGRRELSYVDQANTAELLATLFEAKLPATEVIRIAALSSERSEIKRHFERVGQRVADGASFSQAFASESNLFSPIFTSFLQISDTTNTLPSLLKDLGRFFHKQNSVRQKIISALIYPVILVFASIALLLVVTMYLAPNLEPIFTSIGRNPAGTIAFLLIINDGLRSYWFIIAGGLCILFVIILALLQIPKVKHLFMHAMFRLAIIGEPLRLSALSQLTRSTELLLSSGQPLTTALRIAAKVSGRSSVFAEPFEEAVEAIESGLPAYTVFEQNNMLPKIFKELFRIGEETNRLPSSLAVLSESLATQADRQTQRLLNLLTPALTLILGLGIGFLIYTLMGAILEVNELAF